MKIEEELYQLGLSLTYNYKRAQKLAAKALKKEKNNKLFLYKSVLKNIGKFSIRKSKCIRNDFISVVKKDLKLFDKKVFVLRYEFKLTISEIVLVMSSTSEKVKESLYNSTLKIADRLESLEDEMQ